MYTLTPSTPIIVQTSAESEYAEIVIEYWQTIIALPPDSVSQRLEHYFASRPELNLTAA